MEHFLQWKKQSNLWRYKQPILAITQCGIWSHTLTINKSIRSVCETDISPVATNLTQDKKLDILHFDHYSLKDKQASRQTSKTLYATDLSATEGIKPVWHEILISINTEQMKLDTKLKASAHFFKRFTSRLLKLSFSLYAPITSDECHAWFHLNTASPAARNKEQVNITKKSCPR